MKTLANANDREEILRRMGAVRPECVRKWGKMSAHQMVCHLADSFRGVMGEKPLAPMPGLFGRRIIKWLALDVPLPWAHGLKTMPEMDQEIGGTRPVEFAGDVRDLRGLFERFTTEPRDFKWKPHPIFLEMSDAEWMKWGYRHMDHHFKQFGV
jgi:hypothetical protein